MSRGANVSSIDAVRDFRAVMQTFLDEAREALSSFGVEVNRTLEFLLDEMPQFWKNEMRKADEAIQAATLDLARCRGNKLPGGGTPSCMEEKKALEKARNRRQYAGDKYEATRRWGQIAQREAGEYTGRANQLSSVFDADTPKALLLLDRLVVSLENYRALQFQSAESAPSAGASAAMGNQTSTGIATEDAPAGDAASGQPGAAQQAGATDGGSTDGPKHGETADNTDRGSSNP